MIEVALFTLVIGVFAGFVFGVVWTSWVHERARRQTPGFDISRDSR